MASAVREEVCLEATKWETLKGNNTGTGHTMERTWAFITEMLAATLEKYNHRYGKDPELIERLHQKIEAHTYHESASA